MGSHQLRAVFVGFGGMALRGEVRGVFWASWLSFVV